MTVYEERPVYFPAGGQTLFGVVTEPAARSQVLPVLAITGGGWITGTHRNGMWVRLARSMAGHGFRSMRFDFHGVGESTGTVDRFRLDKPHTLDVLSAEDVVSGPDLGPSILVGTCFGGRSAADAAVAGPTPSGVALLAVPLRDHGQGGGMQSPVPINRLVRRSSKRQLVSRLMDAEQRRVYLDFVKRRVTRAIRRRRRHSPPPPSRYIRNLEALVDAGVPILLMYGDADGEYAEYMEERAGRLAPLFDKAGDLIEVEIYPGRLHGFATVDAQAASIARVERWILERFSQVRPAQS